MDALVQAITEFGAHLKCPVWCAFKSPALSPCGFPDVPPAPCVQLEFAERSYFHAVLPHLLPAVHLSSDWPAGQVSHLQDGKHAPESDVQRASGAICKVL